MKLKKLFYIFEIIIGIFFILWLTIDIVMINLIICDVKNAINLKNENLIIYDVNYSANLTNENTMHTVINNEKQWLIYLLNLHDWIFTRICVSILFIMGVLILCLD